MFCTTATPVELRAHRNSLLVPFTRRPACGKIIAFSTSENIILIWDHLPLDTNDYLPTE
jgi:hypothetical protein